MTDDKKDATVMTVQRSSTRLDTFPEKIDCTMQHNVAEN